MYVKSFKDLRTWQESHSLTLEIYKITKLFPGDEKYGLTSQIRRAAVSVPSNIAEGMGRSGSKDLIRFLIIARASIQEIIYQLILAKDLNYIDQTISDNLQSRYNGLAVGLNFHIKKLNI